MVKLDEKTVFTRLVGINVDTKGRFKIVRLVGTLAYANQIVVVDLETNEVYPWHFVIRLYK